MQAAHAEPGRGAGSGNGGRGAHQLGLGAPDHGLHEGGPVQLAPLQRGRVASVPQDDRAIAEVGDLVQAVRYVEDQHPLAAELAHHVEERLALPGGQARRRLVEDHDLRASGEPLGDLHELPLARRKALDDRVGVDRGPHRAQRLAGHLARAVAVHEAHARRLTPESDVRRDRQVLGEAQLLVDERHPAVRRLARCAWRPGSAVELHRSFVRRIDPREDLHQRRLPRAVLPDDAEHLARPALEADVVERQDAREAPRQTLDAEPQGPTRAGKSALRRHQEPAAMSFSSLARNSSRFSRVTTVGSTVSVPPSGSTLSSPAWRPFRMRTEW